MSNEWLVLCKDTKIYPDERVKKHKSPADRNQQGFYKFDKSRMTNYLPITRRSLIRAFLPVRLRR